MALHVMNTLTREREPFVPIEAGKVKMYVCGPTVYSLLHVGNFRGAIFFNLVRNWLEASGYEVTYVYNFTDVDDKIIAKAQTEGIDPKDVAERYIAEFRTDFARLGLRSHDHNPTVTEHMSSIVDMVGELVAAGKAYVADDGEVLYSVRNFAAYGRLSAKNIDDLESGARVEIDRKKRDPLDFALWKPAKPGEPKWLSPWSEGRPGWHIECSAMARSLLGESIDIHGGGMDLIFPHHENEIAQSEGCTGKPFARYWLHNNMLTFGDRKMSKSIGNILPGREFLDQHGAEVMKYMMLSAHYRSLLDFSDKQVENAISGLARVYSALAWAEGLLAAGAQETLAGGEKATHAEKLTMAETAAGRPSSLAPEMASAIEGCTRSFKEAMDDDFNTPEAFASVFVLVRTFNNLSRAGRKPTPTLLASARAFRDWILERGRLLALFQEPAAGYLRRLDDNLLEKMGLVRAEIEVLVVERNRARKERDFAQSDALRDRLTSLGIALHDSADGTHWEVRK